MGSAEHAHKTLCSFAFYKFFHIFICLHNVWLESVASRFGGICTCHCAYSICSFANQFEVNRLVEAKPQMNLSSFGAPCDRSINQRINWQYEEKDARDASAHRNQKINIKIYECQINKCLVNWDQNRITNEEIVNSDISLAMAVRRGSASGNGIDLISIEIKNRLSSDNQRVRLAERYLNIIVSHLFKLFPKHFCCQFSWRIEIAETNKKNLNRRIDRFRMTAFRRRRPRQVAAEITCARFQRKHLLEIVNIDKASWG